MQLFTAVNYVAFRAYHKRLSGMVSPMMNTFLLLSGYVSLIAGPVLALYDSEEADENEHFIHCQSTTIFVVAQVLYCVTMI